MVSFSYFLGSPNSVLSYAAFDIPSIRPEAFSEPRSFGIHYFGDFLQPFDWATLGNPWTDIFPGANYPPMAVDFFKIFQIFPYKVAVAIYLSTMALATAVGSWILLPNLNFPLRLLASVGLGVFSAPTLSALDRGNISGYLVPIFALYVWATLNRKNSLLAISFGLLVGIKLWPILLLATAFSSNRLKPHLIGLAGAGAVSLLSLLFKGGNFFDSLSGFVYSNLGFSGNNDNQVVLGLNLVVNNSLFIEEEFAKSITEFIPILVTVSKFGVAVFLLIMAFSLRMGAPLISATLALAAGVVGTGTLAPYAWFFVVPVLLVHLDSSAAEAPVEVTRFAWVLPIGMLSVLPNVIPIYHTAKGPSPIFMTLWATSIAVQYLFLKFSRAKVA